MRTTPRSSVLFAFVALVSAGAAVPSRSASACINSVERTTDQDVMLLVDVEDDLAHGKPGAAVQKTLVRFTQAKKELSDDRLERRAQQVIAVAVVRMEGLLAVRGFEASTSAERRMNLEWAVATLRGASEKEPTSPILRSQLAEALSTLPEHQAEARAILEDLAQRDVVPTPYAYKALARLRHWSGDDAGERVALNSADRLRIRSAPLPTDDAAWGF